MVHTARVSFPAVTTDQEEFLRTGKLIASNLDYDLPFIPVVRVISPIRIGMCTLLSRREQRSPKTEAVDVAPAAPGTLLPRVRE